MRTALAVVGFYAGLGAVILAFLGKWVEAAKCAGYSAYVLALGAWWPDGQS